MTEKELIKKMNEASNDVSIFMKDFNRLQERSNKIASKLRCISDELNNYLEKCVLGNTSEASKKELIDTFEKMQLKMDCVKK